jgi:hypothetical protein
VAVAYGVSLRTEYLRYDMSDNVSLSPGLLGVDAGDFIKFRDIDVVRAGGERPAAAVVVAWAIARPKLSTVFLWSGAKSCAALLLLR